MPKTVDFIFDFASPNAYLAFKVLPEITARHNANINIIPSLLGGIFKTTSNQAPMITYGQIKEKISYEMLETKRFIDRHGLTQFKMNPFFPVNTLTIMRGLIAAQLNGDQDRFLATVLKAMWEDGENMSDIDTISDVLSNAGFNSKKILEQCQSAQVKSTLISNTTDSVARGTFGIPTFFVGSEMYFGKDRLRDVEEALSQ